ncbi:DUF2891 domain-containing protein [Novosphingobium lindaniclasticum]|uniref:DUF2891 domain-containing protein n=1 Tax=Novosphingobium lindaniclasticum LE124 TaxID=1096930 RepID=T0HE83_9SPHN|nr:DUF2891 family protein [Novosphingobium lindaniclasticum]EQB14681.1 hypothetical protein L284_12780 [Novosphingobium lindaniclasticum LE124]
MTTILTAEHASRFAQLTLGHLGREYPNKLEHVLEGPDGAETPSALHPVFYGSFDWHSCVHGWWQVMRLLRLFPDMPEAPAIRARADVMLVPEKIAGEIAYLARPLSQGFERPYGWGWLLALHHELSLHDHPDWAEALSPLAESFAQRFEHYLPKLTYPIRHGVHSNSAFALVLAHEWAQERHADLAALIESRLLDWFGKDRAAQAWEPSGDEFLSPTLTEALAMSRVLPPAAFTEWFDAFLPEIAEGRPETLLTPAFVSDRTDGKIAHLDGLNLSRAWCWRQIAAALPAGHGVRARGDEIARRHLDAALPHIAGDYMGEHWLATYALLALGPTR